MRLLTSRLAPRRTSLSYASTSIDDSPTEETLVEQLLADDGLVALIDEFYFEHHVSHGSPMAYHGWGHRVPRSLAQSYDLFARLRRAGVRAHSWV